MQHTNAISVNIVLSPILKQMKYTGCPRKNVPLGEGQTSPKGTFFWDTWYIMVMVRVSCAETSLESKLAKRMHGQKMHLLHTNLYWLADLLTL